MSTVVLYALPMSSPIASTLARIIPIVCVATGLNPAIVFALDTTTIVDVLGSMDYFIIALQIFTFYSIEF